MSDETRKSLDQLFPLSQATRFVCWTKPGSSEGLDQRLSSTNEQILQALPAETAIYVYRLPDGGYEINVYQKK